MEITVFTPTFNRMATLQRLYESLIAQTCRNFEWLIIDDGSNDGTAELVELWKSAGPGFPIVYHWKPNGGKHTAHNLALTLARGKYIAILDSDDWYVPDALETLKGHWDALENEHEYANIEGLRLDDRGELIGSPFPKDVFDSDNFMILFQRERFGDTCGMYRADVLKENPFPGGHDGVFVTEAIIWNRIASRYKTRFVNKVIAYKEYLSGGLTKRSLALKLKNCRTSQLYYYEILSAKKNIPINSRLNYAVNCIRYSLHSKMSFNEQLRLAPNKLEFIILYGAGVLAYLRDLKIVAAEKKIQNEEQ